MKDSQKAHKLMKNGFLYTRVCNHKAKAGHVLSARVCDNSSRVAHCCREKRTRDQCARGILARNAEARIVTQLRKNTIFTRCFGS